MADQAPRSLTNMVFIALLLLAVVFGVFATWEMLQDAMVTPPS